jgi:hypothetical protein
MDLRKVQWLKRDQPILDWIVQATVFALARARLLLTTVRISMIALFHRKPPS